MCQEFPYWYALITHETWDQSVKECPQEFEDHYQDLKQKILQPQT